jgi:putative oxidoreductase
MMNMSKGKCMDYGMLFLRFVVGMGFLLHGLQKFGNMEGTVGFFGMLGLPVFVAYLVAIIETLAGVFLILGIFTRYAGYAVALVMLGAIITLHFKQGFLGGMELPLLYLASGLALAWGGAGKWSVGKKCCGSVGGVGACCNDGECDKDKKSCDGCDGGKGVCALHENK